jgi:hypothetical protein
LRKYLCDSPEALEIKYEGKGIIYWTTRGQLGIGSKIAAATRLQRRDLEKDDRVEIFKEILRRKDKFMQFTSQGLWGTKDILERGVLAE